MMAMNKSERCSTCLGYCSVTVGNNPILLPCGHHTCSRCHQTQWLTSGRNDSEEIDCIKCTLASLSEHSIERHELLMSNPKLFGLANVRAVIRDVRGIQTKVDGTDYPRTRLTSEDTCSPRACQRIHHHRTWSSSTGILPTKIEMERNSTQSCEPSTDKTLVTRQQELDKEPKDKTHTIQDLSSVCGNVLKFTPLDPKRKHKKSKEDKKEPKQLLSSDKSSKDTTACVTNKTEAHDLRHQTYNGKAHRSVPTKAKTSTCSHDSTCEQNILDDYVSSDNDSQSISRSHHHHKRSHKKSKKKKKSKEKNGTKSRQDKSHKDTSTPECKTKVGVKQKESSPQMVNLVKRKNDHRNSEGDTLNVAGNSEDDTISIPYKIKYDTLSNESFAGDDEGLMLSSRGKNKNEVCNLSIAKDSEGDKFPIAGENEGGTFSVAGKDGSESGEVNLDRSPCVALGACASSTRFSSPISLDDYQLKNLLEDKFTPELEIQKWEDSDKDDTELKVQNLRGHHTDSNQDTHNYSSASLSNPSSSQDLRKSKEFHKRNDEISEFDQTSRLGTCSNAETNIAVSPLVEVEQKRGETSTGRLSLDGSILDRSGILYYDPIENSDEDKLVIVSRVMSEASLIGEDQVAHIDSTIKEAVSGIESRSASKTDARMAIDTKVTTVYQEDNAFGVVTAVEDQVKTIKAGSSASLAPKTEDDQTEDDQSTSACNFSQGTEVDHDQLLQSYLKYLSEKSTTLTSTNKEEDKTLELQEKNLVKGFQESYTTSLICSQLANKALNKIKETRDKQKGPYQLSAKMLTGVLNILVQQANLASTICSELLKSTEDMQEEDPEISDSTSENVTKDGTEAFATMNTKVGNVNGSSDFGNNYHSVSTSNACTEEVLADGLQFSIERKQINSERYDLSSTIPPSNLSLLKETQTRNATKDISDLNISHDNHDPFDPKLVISKNVNQATPHTKISKSKDNSGKDKSREDSLTNHFSNSGNKQEVVKSVSQISIREAKMHKANSAKPKDVKQYEKRSHKNSAKQVTHSTTLSLNYSKTLDIPCPRHKEKGKKNAVSVNNDEPTGGRKREEKDVVSSSRFKVSDPTSADKIAQYSLEDSRQQASLGTQVTEIELETIGHKPDGHKKQTPDKQEHNGVKSNKYTTDHNSTSSDKNIDKDRESNNLTNIQPKPPNGKRNLFDSILLEIEEEVEESPCKYRKLQFGKLPQSHVEDVTHLDTTDSCGKVSLDTTGTSSLAKQKCRNFVNSKQANGIRHKSKETPKSAFSNKSAGNVSTVDPSQNATPEFKLINTKSSSRRRSSSVPTSTCGSTSKDGSKSRSQYHSDCCSSRQTESSSNHNSSGNKATQGGPCVSRNVYVLMHANKRDICIQTDLKNVHQTSSKSKRKLDMNEGERFSRFNKATGDTVHSITEGISKTKEKYSEILIKPKAKEQMKELNNGSEKENASKNKNTENLKDKSSKLGPHQEMEKQQRRDSKSKCFVSCYGVKAQSLTRKACDEEHSSDIKTTDVNYRGSDLVQPVLQCSLSTSSMVLKRVEQDASLLTPKDETRTPRHQTRDEEIFACLSFSDSDDDVPLALILDNLMAEKRKEINITTSLGDLEDDQLPKLTVPNASKHTKHSQRRSRCDRPGLETYLEIRNSMSDNSTENQLRSETSGKTWRNSLMPPPLEDVRRFKSRESAAQSTLSESQALSVPKTISPRSDATTENLSLDSTHESDPEQGHLSDVESDEGNNGQQGGGSTKKKKRHRRRKTDKPVVSSSSEECIPKGRRRGFQWRQECLQILDRVYNHHFSDPFRHEVKSKDIPDYYKIVKRGMCFDIIGYKLRCNIYEELRDFFLDVRLVFDNCRLYYKRESPIYRAGLVVKYFFRKIAKEVLMPRTTERSRHPS